MRIPLNLKNCRLIKSDGVQASLSQDKRRGGRALRLDFEFGGSGHALVRIPVSLFLPENYVIKFEVAGSCAPNTLELKLLDRSTDNVWWVNRPNFQFDPKWQTLISKKRHFSYAWGPSREPLKHVAFIDLTLTAASGGCRKGSVYFTDLRFEQLPAAASVDASAPPAVRVSSGRKTASCLIDGDDYSVWQSSHCERQTITFDFPVVRELSALTIDWGDDYAANYQVQICGERGSWRNIDTIIGAGAGRQFLRLPDCDIKQLRLILRRSSAGKGYQIRAVQWHGLDFAPDLNTFWSRIAGQYPPGFFPRYFRNEQSYWTVVGVSGGRQEAIINEEGMLEVGRQTLSVEPFVFCDGELLTWYHGRHEKTLLDGYLPVPVVRRDHEQLSLEVMTFACGSQDDSTLYARYTLRNKSKKPISGRLFLALRQFQVNPPWQFLNTPGGFTPVKCFNHAGDTVYVDDSLRVVSLTRSDAFGATTLASGDVVEHLNYGILPEAGGLCDGRGFGSAALMYEFDLPANDGDCQGEAKTVAKTVDIAVPYTRASHFEDADQALASTIADWQVLKNVGIDIPASPELVDAMRSQLAYILINRDGPAIQPGSRCYRRTWIRDGALTSAALLQHGFEREVRDFIDWFAPYQYPNGKVPCCVDKRGADPTPEHDSHGEFIYLVMEYYRYTRDRTFLAGIFPRLLAAAAYIESLRSETMGADFQRPEKEHLYGILPPSISHEGYSAHPAYSNWDNLFAMKGLDDVVAAATVLESPELPRLTAQRDSFHSCLMASMARSMQHHGIDFIAGAADLGDFDATSTTIGLDPADRLQELPQALKATFERYWQFFRQRRDGEISWENYTPYEWRTVGALVRLGEVGRAHQALDYFMRDRRPRHWNHWAEVIWRNPLETRFIGDAPHGWVGSDFLRSVRNLFVYESGNTLVLAKGIKPDWFDQGIAVKNLPTHFGRLSYTARRLHEADKGGKTMVSFSLVGDGHSFATGVSIKLAVTSAFAGSGDESLAVLVNGVAASVQNGLVEISLPAEVQVRLTSTP